MRRTLRRDVNAVLDILRGFDTGNGVITRLTLGNVRTTRFKNVFKVKWAANRPALWVDVTNGSICSNWDDIVEARGGGRPIARLSRFKKRFEKPASEIWAEVASSAEAAKEYLPPVVAEAVEEAGADARVAGILNQNAVDVIREVSIISDLDLLHNLFEQEQAGKNRKTVTGAIMDILEGARGR